MPSRVHPASTPITRAGCWHFLKIQLLQRLDSCTEPQGTEAKIADAPSAKVSFAPRRCHGFISAVIRLLILSTVGGVIDAATAHVMVGGCGGEGVIRWVAVEQSHQQTGACSGILQDSQTTVASVYQIVFLCLCCGVWDNDEVYVYTVEHPCDEGVVVQLAAIFVASRRCRRGAVQGPLWHLAIWCS